jgi:hypothetical protein
MAMIDGPWAAPGAFVPALTAVLITAPRGGRLAKRLVGAASHSPLAEAVWVATAGECRVGRSAAFIVSVGAALPHFIGPG